MESDVVRPHHELTWIEVDKAQYAGVIHDVARRPSCIGAWPDEDSGPAERLPAIVQDVDL